MCDSKKLKRSLFIAACTICQILISPHCFSQQQYNKTDSLVATLKSAKDDTNKVKVLYKLRDITFFDDLSESNNYNTLALSLSQTLNFKPEIVTGYIYTAEHLEGLGNFKGSMDYFNKDFPIVKELNRGADFAYFYNSLCVYYLLKGDYLTAIDYSNKALQIAEQLNIPRITAETYQKRAEIYVRISDYATATSYLLEAVKLDQEINDKLSLSANYYRLARICYLQNNNDEAIDYLKRAHKIATETNSRLLIGNDLTLLGKIYLNEEEWNKSLDYFTQTIKIAQALRDSTDMSATYCDMATIYCEEGFFNKAIQSVSAALNISLEDENKPDIRNAYQSMGEVYIKQKEYSPAIAYLDEALKIAISLGQKNNISSIYNDLAESYKGAGNLISAYYYSSENNKIKDSVLNEESVKKTFEMGALFNSAKKDKEIALLTKNKKIQELELKKQATLKYSLIAGLVIICILFFFIYRNYRISQSLKLQQLRNKIAIDLHDDVASTLSSIKVFSEIGRRNSIQYDKSKIFAPTFDLILSYSKETIESIADIVWAISPQNDNMEKTIARMRSFAHEILGAKNIHFEFKINDSLSKLKLSMDERKNLYLIFKEAINNIIKHSKANHVVFSVSNLNNELKLLITDDGMGFDPKEQVSGNGLNNMKKRASEIGAMFFIESVPNSGTRIHLKVEVAI